MEGSGGVTGQGEPKLISITERTQVILPLRTPIGGDVNTECQAQEQEFLFAWFEDQMSSPPPLFLTKGRTKKSCRWNSCFPSNLRVRDNNAVMVACLRFQICPHLPRDRPLGQILDPPPKHW